MGHLHAALPGTIQICQKSRRIGCVIPHCNLQCGVTQPILQLFWHICRTITTITCITSSPVVVVCWYCFAFGISYVFYISPDEKSDKGPLIPPRKHIFREYLPFLLQAAMFYFPYYLWSHLEDGLLESFGKDAKSAVLLKGDKWGKLTYIHTELLIKVLYLASPCPFEFWTS